MANALYDKGRESFLGQNPALDWDTDTIKAVLVRTGAGHYVVNLATDQYLSAIASGDRLATSSALTSKTVAAGVADCDDITWAAVAGGSGDVGAIVFYKDTGSAATSPLIAYLDTVTGVPFTPSGADVILAIDNGSNKLFKL